jgi:hypothetical protein
MQPLTNLSDRSHQPKKDYNSKYSAKPRDSLEPSSALEGLQQVLLRFSYDQRASSSTSGGSQHHVCGLERYSNEYPSFQEDSQLFSQ